MALTKVTGHVIKSDTNIISHNINSSGIITAISFDGNVSGVAVTFTGDSTIGSLGITTNLNVGGISTFTGNIDANGDIDVDGHTELDNLRVSGVSTLTGRIFAGGTVIPGYSGADDLTIGAESGNHGITIRTGTTNTGGLFFSDATSAGDNATQWAAGVEYHHGNGELRFYEGGNVRAMFKSGHFQPWSDSQYSLGTSSKRWSNVHADAATIAGNATISGNLTVDGVLTYQDVTNIDSIGIVTARSDIRGGRNLSVVGIVTANQIKFADSNFGASTNQLRFGSSDDMLIYHDGNNSVIKNQTNDLYIETVGSGDDIIIKSADDLLLQVAGTEDGIKIIGDGAVELYHNGIKQFETGSSGVLLPDMSTNTGRLAFGDFGTRIEGGGGGGADDGLYFMTNSVMKWQMNPDGDLIPNTAGAVDIGSASKEIGDVYIADDKKFYAGSDQNISLYHTSSNGINHLVGHPGNMFYHSGTHYFTDAAQSKIQAQFIHNSYCELRHEGNLKFRTSATGIDVTGEVAATQDYPTTRPTLDFNFAAEKKLDPRITFYRTTIGSYIDENGDYRWASANQPKFNHDEVTHESKGLLIEPARTNKLSSGNNIPSGSNSGGSPGPSLVANNVEAPDGSFTARTVDYSNASSNMNSANIEFGSWDSDPSGKTYSASIWVKGTAGHTINFYLDASGQGSSNTGKGNFTLTGKWQRISVYHTYPSGSNAGYLRCGTRSLHSLTQGTATVVSLWGTTIVEESQPGSTIATPIVATTTAADYALIDGEDFTEFFNQVEGTIITSTDTLDPAGIRRPAVIEGDVSNNDRHYLQEANAYQYQIRDDNATVAQIDAGSINTTKNIIAAAYKLNDAAVSFNGSDAATDTSATMPTCTKLKLGEWSGTFYFGHISRFMYYRNRIPNSQLKTLSSQ